LIESKGKRLIWILIIPLFMLIVLIGAEMLTRANPAKSLHWLISYPLPATICFVILLAIYLLLLALVGDVLWGLLLTAILLVVVSGVSGAKFGFLGEYLYPWDFMLAGQLLKLFPDLLKGVNAPALAGALLLLITAPLGMYAAQRRFQALKVRVKGWGVRLGMLAVSVALLYAFALQVAPVKKLYAQWAIQDINWDQTANYHTNGFLLGFALNTKNAIVFPPRDYNEKAILEIVDEIAKAGGRESAEPPAKDVFAQRQAAQKPNIIIVMDEAFWDPTLLGAERFAEDPLPTVHKYQSGWMLSPQFGGGTANVEFEVLTGMSVSFLPQGSIAYQQYVKKPIPSMVSLLAEQGYAPIAIHPYSRWFWDRDDVYEYMGFREFFSEVNFVNPVRRGPYIADSEVARRIMDVVEAEREPVFIYAVTMQNHGPYEANRYGAEQLKVSGEAMTESTRSIVESYAQGAADADQALREMIEHFGSSDEPTIVAFFGDHLPYLGPGYQAYKEMGLIPGGGEGEGVWSLQQWQTMRSTPLVIWSNVRNAKPPKAPLISPSFLGPVLFDFAGLEKPLYYQFLEQYMSVMPGFTTNVKSDGQGRLFRETPESYKELVEKYRKLQYDILFGKRYGVEKLFE
jgi:phosphoglycerol transferase MdoB-like AlkP superfamily enzyme